MDGSKKKEKTKEVNKIRSPELSEYSSDPSRSRASEKGQYNNPSDFMEGESSIYTDPSGSRRNEKLRNKNTSSLMDGITSSVYTDPSGSRRNEKLRNKNTSSLMEGATSSIYTDPSRSMGSDKRRSNNTSSFTEATSSVYTDASQNRSIENRRYGKRSSLMGEATSSAYTDASEDRSSDQMRYKKPSSFSEEASSFAIDSLIKKSNNKGRNKNPLSFTVDSSIYTVNMPEASFLTSETFTSDNLSSDQNSRSTTSKVPRQSQPRENIRLMPFKVKDVLEMIKENPAYKDKSPVMIKVKENDIDQIIEKQNYKIGGRPGSPVSLELSLKDKAESFRMSTGAEIGKTANKYYNQSKESFERPEKYVVENPLVAGADQTQKIFAMPDVQAFPAVVKTGPARRRRRKHRVTSVPRRRVSRPRHRSRSRPVRVETVRPRRVVRRPLYRRRYISPCTPYPMCEQSCISRPYRDFNRPYYANLDGEYYARDGRTRSVVSGVYNTPSYYTRSRSVQPRRVVSDAVYYAQDNPVPGLNAPYYAESKIPSRPLYVRSRQVVTEANCCCNTCEEKLQFIQPGLCNKKKNVWTNEYAVIPAPQVNLIDPCEELDPTIYPRAENPCLRDGQGNPLTDCIGRPLRSPIGKRFLKFSANGSVMDTSLRGNFWTGQPPLCVKCPMPSCSCGPDTTHNWWMSCGYPIMPNMNPFYKRVIAAETTNC